VHLVGFTMEIYYNARSYKRQIRFIHLMITLWRKGMDRIQQNHYRAPWRWESCASRVVLTQLFIYCLVSSVNSSFVYPINYINTKEGLKICKNSFVNNAAASLRRYPGISAQFHRGANKLVSSPKRQGWPFGFIHSLTRWLEYVFCRAVKK